MRNQFGESGEPRVTTVEEAAGQNLDLGAEFFDGLPVAGEAPATLGYEPSIDQINERAAQLDPYNEQPADIVSALAREQLVAEHDKALRDAELALEATRAEEQRQEQNRQKAEEWNAAYEALVTRNINESQMLLDGIGLDETTCTDAQLWLNMDSLRGYTTWQLQELQKKTMRWSSRARATTYAPDDLREDIRVGTTTYDEKDRMSGHIQIDRYASDERRNFQIHLVDPDVKKEQGPHFRNMMIRYKGKGKFGSVDSGNPEHTRFFINIDVSGKIGSLMEVLPTTNEVIGASPGASHIQDQEGEHRKAEQILYRLKQEFGVDLQLEAPEGMQLDMQATIVDLIERAAEDPDAMPIPRYKVIE